MNLKGLETDLNHFFAFLQKWSLGFRLSWLLTLMNNHAHLFWLHFNCNMTYSAYSESFVLLKNIYTVTHTHWLVSLSFPWILMATFFCDIFTVVNLIQLCSHLYFSIQPLSLPFPLTLSLLSCSQMAFSTSLPVHYVDNPRVPYIPSRSNGGCNHTLWQGEPIPVHHWVAEGAVVFLHSVCVWVCVSRPIRQHMSGGVQHGRTGVKKGK